MGSGAGVIAATLLGAEGVTGTVTLVRGFVWRCGSVWTLGWGLAAIRGAAASFMPPGTMKGFWV
ncbi:MAG TPA: hypothetical protein DCP71_13505 [Verrucomicrobiales bacterium]|nr:hypothetical protein [Verrucomicrobiales bacterium]